MDPGSGINKCDGDKGDFQAKTCPFNLGRTLSTPIVQLLEILQHFGARQVQNGMMMGMVLTARAMVRTKARRAGRRPDFEAPQGDKE